MKPLAALLVALKCGNTNAKRATSTVSLRNFLDGLPSTELHHVCVTGNRAHQFMQDHVLLAEHSLSDFEMKSDISTSNRCVVQDYAVGTTLFMVTSDIEDRCAARWKAHSSSCDVLLHAHEGGNCDQLWKLRMITSQCDASLLVFQSDSSLLKCYSDRIEEADKKEMNPLSKHCTAPQTHSLQQSDLSVVLPGAFLETASHVQEKYSNLQPEANAAHGNKTRLRQVIQKAHGGHPQGMDLHMEFLKKTQRLPADAAAVDYLGSFIQLSAHQQDQVPVKDDTIVIDSGSGHMRAGFAGEREPKVVFPMIISRPKNAREKSTLAMTIGDDKGVIDGEADAMFPQKRGTITDFGWMEKVWRHTFEKLGVDPSQKRVMLTEPPLIPKDTRTNAAQKMFETFSVKSLYFGVQATFALFAAEKHSGIVLDIGDSVTHIVPIFEGYVLPHAVQRTDVGGQDLTKYLWNTIRKQNPGARLASNAGKIIVDGIKREVGKVSLDPKDLHDDVGLERTLPNGKSIYMDGSSRYRVAEVLFDPALIDHEPGDAIHTLLHDAINKCDLDTRRHMYNNIVLSGGGTMFKDLDKRLQLEVQKFTNLEVKVVAPKEREFLPWIGASRSAALFPDDDWLTIEKYTADHKSVFTHPGMELLTAGSM